MAVLNLVWLLNFQRKLWVGFRANQVRTKHHIYSPWHETHVLVSTGLNILLGFSFPTSPLLHLQGITWSSLNATHFQKCEPVFSVAYVIPSCVVLACSLPLICQDSETSWGYIWGPFSVFTQNFVDNFAITQTAVETNHSPASRCLSL